MSTFSYNYQFLKGAMEKRDREPNWSEPEKKFLLALIRMHQPVLESKKNDKITLKRKSEAWNDIELNMRSVGYNRSKERIKQQLCRMRVAESKKAKNYISHKNSEKDKDGKMYCPNPDGIKISGVFNDETRKVIELNDSKNSHAENQENFNANEMKNVDSYVKIKSESSLLSPIGYLEENGDILKPINTHSKQTSDKNEIMQQEELMQIKFHKIHTSSEMEPDLLENNLDMNEQQLENLTHTNDAAPLNTIINQNSTTNLSSSQSKSIKRVVLRSSLSREKRLRQLHSYRVAIERERLRNLRIQQKRERILYHKDIQIQNLKLQILRNLKNERSQF